MPRGDATRVESITVDFALTGAQARENARTLNVIGYDIPPSTIRDDDTYKIKYTFNAEYFGRVEECLRAVIDLQRSVGKGTRTGRIESAGSVLLEVFKHLKEIQT